MSLKVYNVLTRKKEDFIPQEKNKVKMYACGITASGNAHLGHAYQAIIFDVIKKYLEYIGYEVTYVRNYTDVDDKIILKARELKEDPTCFAVKMMNKIDKELDTLIIERPTIQSRATECIPDMIQFIQSLIIKGQAYSTEYGDVFFKVSSFKDYGKLSNRNIDETISGVRKDIEPGKLDDRDFALWKHAGADEIYWDSPWGKGRPGWHIECSAMSMKYLGETLDIHGGGKDLIFPHHENEIAQSESLTEKPFAKYWIHNGLVKVNGQKMSKSLNNGIILEDLLNEYNYEVIRMTLLDNSYRSDINIMDGAFENHEKKIYGFYKLMNKVDEITKNIEFEDDSDVFKLVDDKFRSAMNNDFNTSLAISYLYDFMAEMNVMIKENKLQKLQNMKKALIEVYKVLGLLQQNPQEILDVIKNKYLKLYNISIEEINLKLLERNNFKNNREYDKADIIRNELNAKGIIIEDSAGTSKWDIEINNNSF